MCLVATGKRVVNRTPAFYPDTTPDSFSVSAVDTTDKRLLAHLAIPFSTLGVEAPAKDITWKANFGRNHALPRENIDRVIWSSSLTSNSIDDTAVIGEIVFE